MMDKFHLIQIGVVLGTATCLAIGYYRKEIARRRSALMWWLSLCIAAGVTLVFADMYLIEPNWIKVELVQIKNRELAEVLQDNTVVQISDLHLRSTGYRERKLIEELNSLRPDLLFITGDLLADVGGEKEESSFLVLLELIRQIKVRTGIYAVPGNYDKDITENQEKLNQLLSAGMLVLRNDVSQIVMRNGKSVWVSGATFSLDNDWSEWHFQKLIKKIPHGKPLILLNHYPDIFGRAQMLGIPLVLAGHTHGGQIGIPFLVRMSNSANKSKYIGGLYDTGTTKMYISRGIGTTGIPVRLFCRPEIAVLEFVE